MLLTASMNVGRLLVIPCTSPTIISLPFAMIFGRFCDIASIPCCTSSGIFFASCGPAVWIPDTSPITISDPDAINFGSPVCISAEIACGRYANTLPIAGSRLSKRKVPADSARSTIAGPTFRPSARSPRKFSAAAFIDEKDPDSVLAASFEVVPVISISSWIT